jgi:hypothetical protein
MFEELFHKITFGIFRKKDDPAATQTQAPAPPAAANNPPEDATKKSLTNPTQAQTGVAPTTLAQGLQLGNPKPGLQSIPDGDGEDSIQRGGGRRRRRGSRGSRGSRESRSKSKRGGFAQGFATQQAMGFGRAGGNGHRRSKKRNTHKRRK